MRASSGLRSMRAIGAPPRPHDSGARHGGNAASAAGFYRSISMKSEALLRRTSSRVRCRPAARARARSAAERTARRLASTITSPGSRPASSAGLPSATSLTTTPVPGLSPRRRASAGPTGATARPHASRLPAGGAARLSRRPSTGIRSTVTSTVRSWPSRMMVTGTRVPGAVRATIRGSSRECCTRRSPQRTITSPRAIPALAAGPPDVTSATSAPSAPCRPNERARSGVTAWIATPTQPRTTAPCSRIWSTTQRASAIGTANPMPTFPPAGLTMAALIPTTRPSWSTSGPPELPGLIDASVWMKSSYGPAPRNLPLALTMPAVAVCVSPNGFPIATTQSPTLRASESPNGSVGSGRGALTWRTAISVLSSLPTTLASNSSSVAMRTRIFSAPLTTWLLVTMSPSGEMMKPEPRLRLTAGGSPKKRWRKSCIVSGSPSSEARATVAMLTTAGSTRARTSANDGRRSAAAAGAPKREAAASRATTPRPAAAVEIVIGANLLARSVCGELQLDDVALGVAGIHRQPHATGAVAHGGFADHLDALRLEVADDGAHVRRRDAEADVVDVGPALGARIGRRQEVDDAASGTQLDEADRLDPALLDEPEDARVEVEGPRLVPAAEHDVVELFHADRPLARSQRLTPRRPARAAREVSRGRPRAPPPLARTESATGGTLSTARTRSARSRLASVRSARAGRACRAFCPRPPGRRR